MWLNLRVIAFYSDLLFLFALQNVEFRIKAAAVVLLQFSAVSRSTGTPYAFSSRKPGRNFGKRGRATL